MNLKEVLTALQEGTIEPEAVKQKLLDIKATVSEQKTAEKADSYKVKILHEINEDSVVVAQEVEPGIVQVTMQDRVNKNAFSKELVYGLIDTFKEIQANRNNKVIILTGYDNYFASGGTKEGLLAIHEGKVKYTDTNVFRLALDCRIPVIAAMQGHGFGAGWCMGLF